MRYLADILTSIRLVLAIVLFMWAFFNGTPEGAFIIFLVAELTDTFDGTCAKKWPFPKGKEPKYRKFAALYDMISDVLLAAAQVAFLTLRVNLIVGLIIIFFYAVVCGIIELVVYGKLFGHPDNCTRNSLARKNFPLAKKLILTRRYFYVFALGIASVLILFATSWSVLAKSLLLAFGCAIFVFAWFFLSQRRKNISRDAVDLEKKLGSQPKKK